MNYHNITKDDMLNGDGLRVVLWVAGCSHHCRGCQNPFTHNPDGGILFDDSAEREIYEQLEQDYISGITFSGGDPLHEKNIDEILRLSVSIRNKYPDKTIWVYTGFTLKQIQDDMSVLGGKRQKLISMIDVLCDGKYEEDKKSPDIPWVGSSNQNVYRFGTI